MTPELSSSAADPESATAMPPGWWVRGLALHERLAAGPVRGHVVDDAARRRVDRWRAEYGPEGVGEFAMRLADAEIDEDGLLALLTEPPESLAARVSRPAWVDTAERAVRDTSPPPDLAPPEGWQAGFAVPMRSLIAGARDRLLRRSGQLVAAEYVDIHAVADLFADGLGRELVTIAARTLVLELNVARDEGRLTGADGRARFTDFVRRLAEPAGLAKIFTEYPVLARLLGQASTFAADACLELLSRFAADRAAIVDELLGGVDPGQVVAIEARGDKHEHGRFVAILAFADARRVVYQPRDVEPCVRFAAIVRWLNRTVPELALRAVTAVRRSGYGWVEFVDGQPLADLAGADRFYRRQGALLALLHAVHGTDVHYENLIACADQPVLVDVETLFHPCASRPGGPVDPAALALAGSVHRTALLPMIIVGEHGAADMSGLGGDRGTVLPASVVDWEFPATDQMRLARGPREFRGGLNRPRLDDHELDPRDHKPALLDGFRLGYDAIARHRTEFTSLIEGCADLETRVVIRPTRVYANLLDESTHPDLLRDALDRDRALDVLVARAAGLPESRKLLEHERADLWAGDIPLFTGRPGSRDVWTSTGRRLTGLLDRTGLRDALDTVAAMDEMDRRDQEWIISATLATRGPAGGHGAAPPVADPLTGIAAHPERLLATACAVADQIVARSMVGGDRLNWLGLELVDDRQWLVLPMGAGLANGYVGVALFLAQLAQLSGIERYGEVARRAVGALPQLFDILAAQPAVVPVIGPGGLHGLGGIAYALARMSTLLPDDDLRRWAGVAVGYAASSRTNEPGPPGWATGDAGCLAATTAIHAELGLDSAGHLARACADRLLEASAELPSGFADGAAGIGWALAGYGETDAGRAVLSRLTTGQREHGWCTGTAGVAVARTWLTGDGVRASLEQAVRVLSDRPVLRDLSLCHGELGIADVLTALAPHVAEGAAARRRRAGLVLDAIDRYGPCCGTPDGVPTPGLLTGLAGIGYGLLRLGFPERVPSVLLLQPTPGS